jgi:hypothetical protein
MLFSASTNFLIALKLEFWLLRLITGSFSKESTLYIYRILSFLFSQTIPHKNISYCPRETSNRHQYSLPTVRRKKGKISIKPKDVSIFGNIIAW